MTDVSKISMERIDNLDITIADINADITSVETTILQNISTQIAELNTRISNIEATIEQTISQMKYVTETYKNGDNWYRVWSDGWIEQGGYISTVENLERTQTFHKQFTSIPFVVKQTGWDGSYNANFNWRYVQVWDVTTSSFKYNTSTQASGKFRWYACGY